MKIRITETYVYALYRDSVYQRLSTAIANQCERPLMLDLVRICCIAPDFHANRVSAVLRNNLYQVVHRQGMFR